MGQATVIIGGFTISTVLTLFVVPVLHATFDDAAAWLRSRLGLQTAAKVEIASGKHQIGKVFLVSFTLDNTLPELLPERDAS